MRGWGSFSPPHLSASVSVCAFTCLLHFHVWLVQSLLPTLLQQNFVNRFIVAKIMSYVRVWSMTSGSRFVLCLVSTLSCHFMVQEVLMFKTCLIKKLDFRFWGELCVYASFCAWVWGGRATLFYTQLWNMAVQSEKGCIHFPHWLAVCLEQWHCHWGLCEILCALKVIRNDWCRFNTTDYVYDRFWALSNPSETAGTP